MCIAVRLAKSWSTTTRKSKTDSEDDTIGRMLSECVISIAVRLATNDASGAGSMSMCWRRHRSVSTEPQAMRQRRETVEHPFGTLKMRMGATHFLMKRLPKVATEMASRAGLRSDPGHHILGIRPLMAAIRA